MRNTVLIGSYRRDAIGLKKIYEALASSYIVLCPESLKFVNKDAEFVKTESELNVGVLEIETKVLEAIKRSDFVYLFAPNGYIGQSASFEIGYAHAMGIPIYASALPSDPMLSTMVIVQADIAAIPQDIHRPGHGIGGLQSYYKRTAVRRGWSEESAQNTLLLMLEEFGELANAVRKQEKIKRAAPYADKSVAEEIADMQLYVVHLANILNVNLSQAVTDKERVNELRFLGIS